MGKNIRWHWLLSAACAVSVGGTTAATAGPGPSHPTRTKTTTVSAGEGTYADLMARLEGIGQALSQAKDPVRITSLQLQQTEVLHGLGMLSHGEEQVSWFRQAGESLHALALGEPRVAKTALERLQTLTAQVGAMLPGSSVAAKLAYLEMEAEHNARLQANPDAARAQEEWKTLLTRFVEKYPRADQTIIALTELAQLGESAGKNREAIAWYQQLAALFPERPEGQKAARSARRLELPGHTFYLALPKVEDLNTPFDVDQLRGKIVVVYFWSSTDRESVAGLGELKKLVNRLGDRMELVTVTLDDAPETGLPALVENAMPGVHLFQRGGFEGRIATRYGLTSVPTVMLLDVDGKVVGGVTGVASLDAAIQGLEHTDGHATGE